VELHRACWKILDGKSSRVKFDRNIIVTCKLFNKIKFFMRGGETRTLFRCKGVEDVGI
jgi:hypothetical protein